MDKHKDYGILLATDYLKKFVAWVMDLSKPDNGLFMLKRQYNTAPVNAKMQFSGAAYRLFYGCVL